MEELTVPLSDVRFTEAEVEAVADVYRAGWLSQGPNVARFEAAMREYLAVPHAVAVSSGTAALHLACVAIGLRPGDEVIVPSLTFAATVSTVLQCGATPVFADIASVNRPWLSADTVERAIGPRTRAIVTVAYGGHPGDAVALRELAGGRGLHLIEDAAHALGATVQDAKVGTIGDVAAFSFFANKNLPLGEGGLLVTADPELARRATLLRSHGLSADTWARHHGADADYDVLEPGYNYRLDEPRAALGAVLLERLDRDNERRALLADAYRRAMRELAGASPALAATDVTSAWHIYPLLLDDGVARPRFRAAMRSAGVQTSIHYPPLHLTTAYAHAGRGAGSLPVTEEYGRRSVTVPLFPHMTEAQHSRVVSAIRLALTA